MCCGAPTGLLFISFWKHLNLEFCLGSPLNQQGTLFVPLLLSQDYKHICLINPYWEMFPCNCFISHCAEGSSQKSMLFYCPQALHRHAGSFLFKLLYDSFLELDTVTWSGTWAEQNAFCSVESSSRETKALIHRVIFFFKKHKSITHKVRLIKEFGKKKKNVCVKSPLKHIYLVSPFCVE